MVLNERHLWITLFVTLGVRLILAALVPMTGDEVYFVEWGRHLDYGYYDHTPMVGWFLAAMLYFGDAPVWLRLPQILIVTFIGWAIYRLLRDRHPQAVMAAILFLIAPVNILGMLITTDTPLLLWSFLSALCFYRAQERDAPGWYLLAGLMLGLAFFSKFFAGLLGVAYVLYILFFVRRGWRPWRGIGLIILGALPFIFLNLLWNYYNCWDNYLFNLLNRTEGNHFSFKLTGKYLLTLIYLLSPAVVYYYIKEWRSVREKIGSGVFIGLFMIPFALFFLLSLWVSIGLHWLLSFYPFVFIGMGLVFSATALRRTFYFMLPYTLVHVLALSVMLFIGSDLFRDNENTYKDLVYGFYSDEIVEGLKPYQKDYILATDSYTESAVLSYRTGVHVPVLGIGSHHARQDDIITDFRKLDGKNIVLISYSSKLDAHRAYFDSLEIHSLPIADTEFYYFLGKGFQYENYRREVIEPVLSRYYQIPDYLPVGRCNMLEWYKLD